MDEPDAVPQEFGVGGVAGPKKRPHPPLSDKGRRKLSGCFAIDVKGRRCPWRLIIRPLNENHDPFVPCHIDEIAETVEVVAILEASKHYE